MKLSSCVILITLLCAFAMNGTCATSTVVYTKMEKDLRELKAEFNAASDKTRLVFILSPT